MYITKVDTYKRERFHIYANCDSEGASILDEIINGLDKSQIKSAEKLSAAIEKAAIHGPTTIPKPQCHQIEGSIYQFRADDIRLLWFYDKGSLIICAHSFVKKCSTTPRKHIKQATKFMTEYFSAKEKGELVIMEENDEQGGI